MAAEEPDPQRRAPWSARAGAWLIDVAVVTVIVGVAGDLLGLGPGLVALLEPVALGRHGLLLFGYWTLFEGRAGQSPGKLVLDLRVAKLDGEPLTFADAAVESFGKAFLLPVDLGVGLVWMPGERRRLFNRLSRTVVLEVEAGPPTHGATATTA